jgi:hypothetical protein
MKSSWFRVPVVLAALATALPAAAHHSFAMFDLSKTVTVKGTVTEFRWTNPHVALLVKLDPLPGASPEVWSMELGSPSILTHGGWTTHTFKPGDRIELVFNPLRDGGHAGTFDKATFLATGQVISSDRRLVPGLQ